MVFAEVYRIDGGNQMTEEELAAYLENWIDRIYNKDKYIAELMLEALDEIEESRGRG